VSRKSQLLGSDEGARDTYVEQAGLVAAGREAVSAVQMYPSLLGLRPDLYRCFIELTWRHASANGRIGLVHPESHLTDEKAGHFRGQIHRRLRRHWHFRNETRLFEIGHTREFGVNVYGESGEVDYLSASYIYHPKTIVDSLRHDGTGELPAQKDANGDWDVRPHARRISRVTAKTLAAWSLVDSETADSSQAKMVFTITSAGSAILEQLIVKRRIADLPLHYSTGWNERNDKRSGKIIDQVGAAIVWSDVILQGANIGFGNPFQKYPEAVEQAPQGWPAWDKPGGLRSEYDAAFSHWGDSRKPARSAFRIAWRNMADNMQQRTLIPAVIPPGTAHVHGITSAGFTDTDIDQLPIVAATMGSLLFDFMIRATPKSTISAATVKKLPLIEQFQSQLALRFLRLNSLTREFAPLWEKCFSSDFVHDSWAQRPEGAPELEDVSAVWTPKVPLRRALDRRQAQVEIDVLVALALAVSIDDLCALYVSQFSVMRKVDMGTYFDSNGNAMKGVGSSAVSVGFALDREADMRQAYAHFGEILKECS
jgi:hypothetical protein